MMQGVQVNWGGDTDAMVVFFLLATLWGLIVTIFWMRVGWRAMRAHERIADSSARLAVARSPAAEPPQAP